MLGFGLPDSLTEDLIREMLLLSRETVEPHLPKFFMMRGIILTEAPLTLISQLYLTFSKRQHYLYEQILRTHLNFMGACAKTVNV